MQPQAGGIVFARPREHGARVLSWRVLLIVSALVSLSCQSCLHGDATAPPAQGGDGAQQGAFFAQADGNTPSLDSRTYGPPSQAARIEAIEGDTRVPVPAPGALRLTVRVLVHEPGLYAFETMLADEKTQANLATAGVQAALAIGVQRVAFVVPLALLTVSASSQESRAFLVPGVNGAQLPADRPPGAAGPGSRSLAPFRRAYVTQKYPVVRASGAGPASEEESRRREAADPRTPKGTLRFKFKNR